MVQVALFEPEIPPNTGNIIRLCANTGTPLHLIKPLGFDLTDRQLRRAGLDYHQWAQVQLHDSFDELLNTADFNDIYAISTKGHIRYDSIRYDPADMLLFGPESRGLPANILAELGSNRVLRIPMQSESRSINLANAAAILVYEAWRQSGFNGAQ